MSLNNDNNPHVMVIPLGSPSADATVTGGLSFGKSLRIIGAHIVNQAVVAASDTNYIVFSLKAGARTVATLDTRAAGQGALADGVPKSMVISAAESKIAPLELITVLYDETDTGTNVALTNAVCIVNYSVI